MSMPKKRVVQKPRRHVALLVETSLASGRDILRGIARFVREHEPWALYHEPRSLEELAPRWLRRWRGDGAIARIQNRALAEQIQALGIPVVDVLGVVPSPFPLVHVKNASIARLAAGHLLERGFRQFAFVGIEGENWSEQRRDAFAESVREAGGTLQIYELPRHAAGMSSWERVEGDLATWVGSLTKPVGVMVCSDQRGSQFLEACRRANARVPDEVAVIGVDDDEPLCEVCNPPLSSVRPGHAQVGFQAARLLAELMAGRERPGSPLLLEPEGVTTRLSTEVLAIDDRRIADVLRLIREHACEGIRIDALAQQVGMSRSVLQRRFRGLLHRSLHEEILHTRLRRARELLVRSDLSLAEVAERSGFTHQEYLGAVCKAHLGKTPAQVRKESRG